MIAAAITRYDLVSPGSVANQHGPYGDPASPTTGSNSMLEPTTDQPTEDAGLAGVIGWTQPALTATESGVNVPGVGVGTAQATVADWPDNATTTFARLSGIIALNPAVSPVPAVEMAIIHMASTATKCPAWANQSEAALEMIERNLAAHYYAMGPGGGQGQGRLVKKDDVGEGVSRTWATPTPTGGLGLKATTYGQAALSLDCTGCLASADATATQAKRPAKLLHIGNFSRRNGGGY